MDAYKPVSLSTSQILLYPFENIQDTAILKKEKKPSFKTNQNKIKEMPNYAYQSMNHLFSSHLISENGYDTGIKNASNTQTIFPQESAVSARNSEETISWKGKEIKIIMKDQENTVIE